MPQFVWFVVLLAWTPELIATPDSGVRYGWTLNECHNQSLRFSKKYNTPIQLCMKITKTKYDIIASHYVTFSQPARIINYTDAKTNVKTNAKHKRLTAALRAIGRLHVGKSKDSVKVRRIIRRALR